jgi:hypothetical protein
MDFPYLGPPTTMNYTAQDFFQFYDVIFTINTTQTNYFLTTQWMFLSAIQAFFDPNDDELMAIDDRLSRLYELLAVPPFTFNNVVYGGPTYNMGTSITLAKPSYRVPLLFLIELIVVDHRTVHALFVYGGWFPLNTLVFRGVMSLPISPNPQFIPLPRNRHRVKSNGRPKFSTPPLPEFKSHLYGLISFGAKCEFVFAFGVTVEQCGEYRD